MRERSSVRVQFGNCVRSEGTTLAGRPNFRIESGQVMVGRVFVVAMSLVMSIKSSSWLR